jgi:hypothetical protein
MLVQGVGQLQYTVFVPNVTPVQRDSAIVLRAKLQQIAGGVTVVPSKGYWNPPKGVTIVEDGYAYVVVTEPDYDAAVRDAVQDYASISGEQSVLLTRNNLDVFYIHKEQ